MRLSTSVRCLQPWLDKEQHWVANAGAILIKMERIMIAESFIVSQMVWGLQNLTGTRPYSYLRSSGGAGLADDGYLCHLK